MALAAASIGGANTKGVDQAGAASGSIEVWVDAPREAVTDAYIKSHPDVKVKKVIYDGDGNGATGLQTKIQLWNRTGSGWPDVVFSEQANDPVWMGQKPFDFAADLKGAFPAGPHQGLAGTVARAVHRHRAPSSAYRTTWRRRCCTSTRS